MKRNGQTSSEAHLSGGGPEAPLSTSTPSMTPAALAILSFGLGSYLGWNTINASPSLLPPATVEAIALMNSFTLLNQVLLITLLVGLGVWAYKQKRLPEKLILVLSAGFASVGTAIIYLFRYSDAPVPWIVVVGMLMTASRAGFVALWGKQICSVALKWVPGVVAAGYAISYALGLLVASLRPEGAFLLHALLPALSGIALWLLNKEPTLQVIPVNTRTSTLSIPYRFFFGIGLLGLIFKLILDLSETKTSQPNELDMLLGGLVAALVIVIVVLAYPHEINYPTAVRSLLPPIIFCTFLVLFVESGQQFYEVFIIGASWTCFGILTWTLWRAIASRSRVPAMSIFSIGRAILSACVLVAIPAQALIKSLTIPPLATAAVLSVLSVFVSTFLLSERYIADLVERQRDKLLDTSDLVSCRRCIELAKDGLNLTEREQTISLLVLQGEDNASIQKKLFITNNTLRVHLRNIYAKTSVHSRQEFISLLKSFV